MFSYTIGMTETNDQSWCFKRTPVGKQLSYLNLALCGCDKSVPVLSTVLASLCLNPSAVTLTPVCVECCNPRLVLNFFLANYLLTGFGPCLFDVLPVGLYCNVVVIAVLKVLET